MFSVKFIVFRYKHIGGEQIVFIVRLVGGVPAAAPLIGYPTINHHKYVRRYEEIFRIGDGISCHMAGDTFQFLIRKCPEMLLYADSDFKNQSTKPRCILMNFIKRNARTRSIRILSDI
uniref:Uncharacterized protein n=1 Tax=Glossina austeni TaxID=7395 RepID=A0A1A9V909_GLOAU